MIALHNERRVKAELFISEQKQGNQTHKYIHIISQANTLKLPIKYIPKPKLEKYAPNQPHQGVILKCDPLPYVRISQPQHLLVNNKKNGLLWVFLDQITDPQNFGAILRTCFFLGIDGVMVNEANRCPLTPTVNKTSAGALELLEINCVSNPLNFIREAKNEKWKFFCTGSLKSAFGKKNMKLKDLALEKEDNVIVSLGSEGFGVSDELSIVCDKSLVIEPMIAENEYVFPKTLVDSLNVSVATGIILNEIKSKMK